MADVTVLFALLLAGPLGAAVVAAWWRERARTVAAVVGTGIAGGWLVLVAATGGDDPVTVELGRLVAQPLLAAAAAGLALLVAAAPPRTSFATAAALTGMTVFPAAAAATQPGPPDRPLAAGVVLLAMLAAGRSRTQRSPATVTVLVAAALLVTIGLALDDVERAAVLVVAGAGVVAVVPAVFAGPGTLLLPVVLLGVERTTAVSRPVADGLDPVLVTALAVAFGGACALAAVRSRPVIQRMPAAGALAAIVLLAGDLPELRRAGLLLAAAAVVVAVGRHPLALLAALPGVGAAVDAAGLATGPEHAAIGVAVLAVAAGASLRSASTPTPGRTWRWSALPGVVFGVVPVWGWAGVDLGHHTEAIAVAVAVGFVVLATSSVGPALRAVLRRPAPTGAPVPTGAPAPPEAAQPSPSARPVKGVRVRGGRLVAPRSASADHPDGIAHPDE